ncbi:MAG: Jag N-terminal domain-containing protein [Clostridiales Family XIII bacterium]|jgi:spoIIIJ-associated protein|nr:Jag N-terminal domain-containing protein [Clostridiales Family XIII bacterium]
MKIIEKYGPDVETAKELAIEESGLSEKELIIEVLQKPKKGIAGLLGFSESVPAKVRVTAKNDFNIEDGTNGEVLPGKIDLRKKGKIDPAAISTSIPKKGKFEKEIKVDENLEKYEGEEAVFVKDLVKKSGFNIKTDVYINDDVVEIKLSGNDAKFLIGKDGKTIGAFSYLLSLIALKKEFKRIRIDVGNYNKKRIDKSIRYATKKLERVLKTKKPEVLSAMNRIERKAVHDALQKNENIETKSEGKEPHRRIVITYKEKI